MGSDSISQAPQGIVDGFCQVGAGLLNIGRTATHQGTRAFSFMGRQVLYPAVNAIAVIMPPLSLASISTGSRWVKGEIVEMARGVEDVYLLGASAIQAALAKVDQIADRTLSPPLASVAKSVVRALPVAALTTGILVNAPSYCMLQGVLAGASALISGRNHVYRGVGLGFAGAGAVHLATGLVTGNVGSLLCAGFESAYAARIFRGTGLTLELISAIAPHGAS